MYIYLKEILLQNLHFPYWCVPFHSVLIRCGRFDVFFTSYVRYGRQMDVGVALYYTSVAITLQR